MRLLVQWASTAPEDWETTDSAAFRDLPKRQDPSVGGRPVLGVAPGYLYALQAREDIWSGYDHMATEVESYVAGSDPLMDTMGVRDGELLTRISGWNDGSDWAPGSRWARVATYFPMRPRPDLNGAIAPITRHTLYAEPDLYPTLAAVYANDMRTTVVEVQDLTTDWASPSEEDTRHGIWVGNPSNPNNPEAEAHRDARSVRGWREWSDHLTAVEVDAQGRLKGQKAQGRYNKLAHTRTYFQSDTALASSVHSGGDAPDFEQALLLTTSAAASLVSSVAAAGQVVAVFTSPVGEPDDPQWTSGVGTFVVRCALDIPSVGVDLTYGLLTQGAAPGHFGRVQAGVPPSVELESHEQDAAAFSGGGISVASFTGDWSAGASSDRFECLLSAVRVVGHGSQNITVQVNDGDGFADGDWPGPTQLAPVAPATAAWVAAPIATQAGDVSAAVVPSTGAWTAPSPDGVAGPSSAPVDPATGAWVAVDPDGAAGPASTLVAPSTGAWTANPLTAILGTLYAPVAPAVARFEAPSISTEAGAVSAALATATGSWVALSPAALAGGVSVAVAPATGAWVAPATVVAPGQVTAAVAPSTGAWVVPGPAGAAGAVSTLVAAATGSWVANAPLALAGAASAPIAPAIGAWVAVSPDGLPGAAVAPVGPAAGSWVAPALIVAPGAITVAVGAASGSWTAAPVGIQAGSVGVNVAPATGAWVAAGPDGVAGAASAVVAPASGVWAVVDPDGVAGPVLAPLDAATGLWVAAPASIQAGAVIANVAPATGAWTAPSVGALLGTLGVVLDTIIHPTAAVASLAYGFKLVDTIIHPTATADTIIHPTASVDTEV